MIAVDNVTSNDHSRTMTNTTLTTIRRNHNGRTDRDVSIDDAVRADLAADAVVAMAISGGKDSEVMAIRVTEHLDAIGHKGARVLIHADLGRVEWKDSLPSCERIAARTGLELIVVRRAAGDMMDRWLTRWHNNVARYLDLSCVKTILPWSTPSMRFCTSELKTAVITRELCKRYPGQKIVNVCGVRRDESSARSKAPISKPNKLLARSSRGTSGRDWNAIADWSEADVFAFAASRGTSLHEAYSKYGMSRVSCVFCIMGNAADLAASAACPDNQDVYREMVNLEIASAFAFQSGGWLGDVAPDLLDDLTRVELSLAKEVAAKRDEIESTIPDHLLYTAGWPEVMPSEAEAELLADVRRKVAALYGWDAQCVTAESVTARYAGLMAAKDAKARA